jgi:hypothetical protein
MASILQTAKAVLRIKNGRLRSLGAGDDLRTLGLAEKEVMRSTRCRRPRPHPSDCRRGLPCESGRPATATK